MKRDVARLLRASLWLTILFWAPILAEECVMSAHASELTRYTRPAEQGRGAVSSRMRERRMLNME